MRAEKADVTAGRSLRRWAVIGLAGIAIVAATLAVQSAPALAAPTSPSPAAPAPASGPTGNSNPVTWSVQPATAKKPDTRPTYSYTNYRPGSTHEDYVAIDNFSTTPQTFAVYASDAFNTAGGGFDLLAAAEKPKDVGSWVRFAKSSVRVPARSSVIVPFTVTIPDNATPGFHVGGVVASLSVPGVDSKGNQVLVDRRVGVRMFLQVVGPLHPVLAVKNPTIHFSGGWNPVHPGSATVTYTLTNTGNVPLQAHQALQTSGLFGLFGKNMKMADAPLLLPGNSIQLSVKVPQVWPAVTLSAKIAVAPFTTLINLPQPPDVTHANLRTWAVCWPWVIAAGLILALLALWVTRRIRRWRGRRGTPPEPPKVKGPEKTPVPV